MLLKNIEHVWSFKHFVFVYLQDVCERCVQDMCKMCARCAKDVCKICKKVDSFVPRPDPDIPLDPAHRVEKKEADNRFNTGNDTYWQGIF